MWNIFKSGKVVLEIARKMEEATEVNHRLDDGSYVDILTPTVTYQVCDMKRASNWKLALGQAIHTAAQMKRRPGIVLVLDEMAEYAEPVIEACAWGRVAFRYYTSRTKYLSTELPVEPYRPSTNLKAFPMDYGE